MIPECWINHTCTHMEDGLSFKITDPSYIAKLACGEEQSFRSKGQFEVEAPMWQEQMDASKNIGYPVREEGSYGSHCSHDSFDDESWP